MEYKNKQIDDKNWNDWKWQEFNSITDDGKYHGRFKIKVSPYYYSLMNYEDENCPIKKQAFPSELEDNICKEYSKYGIDINDSLAEERMSPVENLVHRYPDRVLLTVTNNCFMYCRFCTRKRLTGSCCSNFELEKAFLYIEMHNEIRDVLISGGDPFTLEDETLEKIIIRLRAIKHVEIIRIGTRAPVVMPMRVTDKLVNILKKYHPIWINTHFNHPKEITNLSIKACNKIVDAGIPLGNQSVLLRDINDSLEIYKELCLKLVKNRIRPYYLYQCDIGKGNEHFRTKVQAGIDIIKGLRQYTTGFAIPTFVIDAPNGGGKIAINPNNIIEETKEKIVLCNKDNQLFIYPEIQD